MNFGKVAAAIAMMTLATAQAVAASPAPVGRLSVAAAMKAPAGARLGAKRSNESKAIQGATLVLVVVAGAAAIAGVVAAADGGKSG